MDAKQKAEAQEMFDQFDKDGSGFLETSEIQTVLSCLNIDLTEEERQEIVDDLPDKIGLDEFVELVSRLSNVKYDDRFRTCLAEFDPEGKGYMTRDELKNILTAMGNEPMDDEEAESFLNDIDINDDGKIELDELAKFLYPRNQETTLEEKESTE